MNDRTVSPVAARRPPLWDRFVALVANDGSAAQPALSRLAVQRAPLRDVADALHCLALLHGHDNGVVGAAVARARQPALRDWFAAAAPAFAGERDWLSRLVAAVGPLPSTPGQTESEAALAVQRHALDMLAGSERAGVAIGAAAALIRDWRTVRALLATVAARLEVAVPASRLPGPAGAQALADRIAIDGAEERGFLFGAQQLLAQQRGLWGLIDARAEARPPA